MTAVTKSTAGPELKRLRSRLRYWLTDEVELSASCKPSDGLREELLVTSKRMLEVAERELEEIGEVVLWTFASASDAIEELAKAHESSLPRIVRIALEERTKVLVTLIEAALRALDAIASGSRIAAGAVFREVARAAERAFPRGYFGDVDEAKVRFSKSRLHERWESLADRWAAMACQGIVGWSEVES